MKTLFLMCGLPFSGKSSDGNVIAGIRKATLISLDDINESRGLFGSGMGAVSPEEWAYTHQIALSRLREVAERGVDIVVDDTNCFRFLRDNYRSEAEKYGYKVIVVVTDTPLAEIKRRISRNELSRQRDHVTDSLLVDLANRFEWPGADEIWASSATLLSELQQHR